MKYKVKQDYVKARKESYPDQSEQIGALVKAVKALTDGLPIPDDALEIISQVDEVKDRFPKPES